MVLRVVLGLCPGVPRRFACHLVSESRIFRCKATHRTGDAVSMNRFGGEQPVEFIVFGFRDCDVEGGEISGQSFSVTHSYQGITSSPRDSSHATDN